MRALALAPLLLALAAVPARAEELAPRVEHQPLQSIKKGEPAEVRARITSAAGIEISEALVYVRVEGIVGYSRVAMKAVSEVPGIFVAQIPAALTGAGFAYYVEAFDADGNGPGRAGTPESPFVVAAVSPDLPVAPAAVVAAPAPVPAAVVPVAAVQAAPAVAPRPTRSQLPTAGLFALTGLGLGAGVIGQVGFQSNASRASDAFKANSSYLANDYRQGGTYGTVSVIGFVVAGVALAGAITYLAWPDAAPPKPAASVAPPAARPAPINKAPEPEEGL